MMMVTVFKEGCMTFKEPYLDGGRTGTLDTRDKKFRAALVQLGWTPPAEGKECVIDNGLLSWCLRVDGQEIHFQGSWNAEYFYAHYKSLGYRVRVTSSHKVVQI